MGVSRHPFARCALAGLAFAALALAPGLLSAQGASSPLDRLTPVTNAQLLQPPPQDWLMWRRTLDSWGYSPLKQIDTGNVHQLTLAWSRGLEPGGPQEGTPLVHDGVLYFPNPKDVIQAFDATTGDLLWEHRRTLPPDLEKFINAPYINRNIAIHGTLIIDMSADGYVYALDARTGKEVWNTLVVDYHAGPHQTSGPIVVDDKVITGRGCEPLADANPNACVIVAHDVATGRELWRTRTIPGPGEKGNETWGDIPFMERKHVGAWMAPSYDPELKLLYIGTSVTSPAPKFLMAGNDKKYLYHNCTLALDVATGKIVWYYQHLVDHWDLDHTFERLLVDTEVAPAAGEVAWINPRLKPGEKRKVITGIPGKTGIVYTLDRRTGEFLWARPTIRQNVVAKIDGRTGAVTEDPASLFRAKGDSAFVCPGIVGGRNWPAGAYSPLTNAMYVPLQNMCSQYTVVIGSRKEPSSYGVRAQSQIAPGTTNVGTIYAVSAGTGHLDWKVEQRAALLSVVTTGGGLLFGGDVAGRFRAYDQRTGAVLWQTPLGAQVTGFPITYAVGERQYVAVSVGQAVNTAQYLALTPEIRPSSINALYVFALPPGWEPGQTSRAPPPPLPVAAATPVPLLSAQNSACRRSASSGATSGGGPEPLFSAARLAEGRRLFTDQQCAVCHGENLRGSGSAPALADPGFQQAWAGRSLRELFDCLKSTMPPGRSGELSDADYVRVMGVILDANGWNVAGKAADALPDAASLAQHAVPRRE